MPYKQWQRDRARRWKIRLAGCCECCGKPCDPYSGCEKVRARHTKNYLERECEGFYLKKRHKQTIPIPTDRIDCIVCNNEFDRHRIQIRFNARVCPTCRRPAACLICYAVTTRLLCVACDKIVEAAADARREVVIKEQDAAMLVAPQPKEDEEWNLGRKIRRRMLARLWHLPLPPHLLSVSPMPPQASEQGKTSQA
jgi:hypothetical protein